MSMNFGSGGGKPGDEVFRICARGLTNSLTLRWLSLLEV